MRVSSLALFALCVSVQAGDSLADRMKTLMPVLMEEGGVTGLSFTTFQDGKRGDLLHLGKVHGDRQEKVGATTLFQAASLTKPVFAYACLRYVDRGVLDLDKPLHQILPNGRMDHDPRYKTITPRHVLSHRSGLPNWGGDKLDLNFEPGSSFGYSGEGFVYLGQVLEKLSGKTIAQIMEEEVFKPLGMKHSALVWNDYFEKHVAWGHSNVGEAIRERRKPDSPNTAASLHTNATEYARFVTALYSGEGLKPQTHKAMFTSQGQVVYNDTPVDDIHWGLGVGLTNLSEGPMWWHWGDNGFFKAFVIADISRKDGFLSFTNSESGLAIMGAVLETYKPGIANRFAFLEYEQYDAPGRKERLQAEKAVADKDFKAAVPLYKKALKTDPENQSMKRTITWLEDTLRIEKSPVTVPEKTLQSYVGKYGPRTLAFKNGRLYYKREDRPEYALTPLNQSTFTLDGLFWFRLEVGKDEAGNPNKIIGHYLDGNTDQSPRDR